MTPTTTPSVGDVWFWPDGKIAILTAEHIAAERVVVRFGERDIVFPLRDGRRRDEPHILAVATAVFGVDDVQ